MNGQILDTLFTLRQEEFANSANFNIKFVQRWLPEAGITVAPNTPASLCAPLYPEVYVFGPRVHTMLNCVRNTLDMFFPEREPDERVLAFTKDLRNTYQDEFGDINDFDWAIYVRFLRRNNLMYTTRISQVYDLLPMKQPRILPTSPTLPNLDVILQEMSYYELLGPGMQRLQMAYMQQGAKRHAAFVKKWDLRKVAITA